MTQGYVLVEFLQPCLSCGNQEYEGAMDRFQRSSDGSIIWSQAWWHAVLNKAKKSLNMDNVKLSDIHFSLSVDAETSPYKRRYSGTKYRTHEAINAGATVKFEFALENVTTEELTKMLNYIGTFVGISPYGYNLGFGKFKVVEVTDI